MSCDKGNDSGMHITDGYDDDDDDDAVNDEAEDDNEDDNTLKHVASLPCF